VLGDKSLPWAGLLPENLTDQQWVEVFREFKSAAAFMDFLNPGNCLFAIKYYKSRGKNWYLIFSQISQFLYCLLVLGFNGNFVSGSSSESKFMAVEAHIISEFQVQVLYDGTEPYKKDVFIVLFYSGLEDIVDAHDLDEHHTLLDEGDALLA
jgi:hypothetical protein